MEAVIKETKYDFIASALSVPGVYEYVNKRVEAVRYFINDYIEIEYRILREVGRFIERKLQKKEVLIKDIFGIVKQSIALQISDNLKKANQERLKAASDSYYGELDERFLTRSHGNPLHKSLNEKIALLSEGDSTKVYILEAWSFGLKSSEIARELSLLNGKSFNTNEMYIKRYKRTCQNILTNAA